MVALICGVVVNLGLFSSCGKYMKVLFNLMEKYCFQIGSRKIL